MGVGKLPGYTESGRAEDSLLEHLGSGAVDVLRLGGVAGQTMDQGNQGGRIGKGCLRVERADLDGAQTRMRAQLPPEPRVVRHVCRARQQSGQFAEVGEVAQRSWRARARPAAEAQLAR